MVNGCAGPKRSGPKWSGQEQSLPFKNKPVCPKQALWASPSAQRKLQVPVCTKASAQLRERRPRMFHAASARVLIANASAQCRPVGSTQGSSAQRKARLLEASPPVCSTQARLQCVVICHPHLMSTIYCTEKKAQECGLEHKTGFVSWSHIFGSYLVMNVFNLVSLFVGGNGTTVLLLLFREIIWTFATTTILSCVRVGEYVAMSRSC